MASEAALVVAIPAAIAAGLVGCFAVMRRMTLAADAISHVALPGIGAALALGIHPLFGAVTMLCFGALLIWTLERRTRIATETVIGVVFSAALAVGSLTSSGEELVEALFGSAGNLGPGEMAFGFVAALAIIVFVLRYRDRFTLALVSTEIARTSGLDVSRLNLWFLEVFALTVALGLRYLGVLLMGSLIIIPAATAKRLARSLAQMLAYSAGFAVVATVVGWSVARQLSLVPGPVIVALAATMFLASLLGSRKQQAG